MNSALSLAGASLGTSEFFRFFERELIRKPQNEKIIIVGAGLSGLVAGAELKKAGHEVIILEARSTCGGRIRTIREPFADGLHAEAGASRIHEDHHLVQQYAKQYGLNLVPFYPTDQNDLLDVSGNYVRFKEIKAKDYQHYNKRYRDNIFERMHHPVLKIAGGMDRLPRAIAATLKEEIYYGAPVVKIEQDAEKVRAYYQQADEQSFVEVDRLICTLPTSVLKFIEISPALPEEKSQAIFQMPYYSTCRILFQTRKRFWERQGLNGFGIYENGELWHPTFDQKGPRGILAYYPGQYAIRGISKTERLDYARKVLGNFFPEVDKYVEGHYSKFWDEDQYAKGAVSVPEMIGKAIDSLSEVEGRIHFAGEHLSASPRWMEGAIESGLRVAKEVNEKG